MSTRQFDQAAAAAACCMGSRENNHVMDCELTLRIGHEQASLERALAPEAGA